MKYFFIGIAGAGMSAIAQYLKGKGHEISGSDRVFLKPEGNDTREKLQNLGIRCYAQGETVPDKTTDFVVVSTAIEDSVPEYKFAKDNNIKTIHRSDLLAEICGQNKTIAVSGTSGKSTTTAMIFTMLDKCGYSPSLISGAGLTELQEKGLIGNAYVGKSDFLVIETDESDGTIVKYHPEIGLILNIDKDHKEIKDLLPLFQTFADHTKNTLIVNTGNKYSKQFSKSPQHDFNQSLATDFAQTLSGISFKYKSTEIKLPIIGKHNMENALAAIVTGEALGLNITDIAKALAQYKGIYRRSTIIKSQNDITIIDDFAHNPAKIYAAISSCQIISKRVIAWFQPHGFAPTKLMKDELIEKLSQLLRPQDIIIFSKIYYAGGTADQTVTAEDFIQPLTRNGIKALYIPERENIIPMLKKEITQGDIILLMGARDPSLSTFAEKVSKEIF